MATTRSPDTAEGPDASNAAVVAVAAIGVALTVGAFALYSPRAALSVAFGAGVAVLNLVTMRAIIRALLRPPPEADAREDVDAGAADDDATTDHVAEGKRGGAAWGAFAVVKIIVLFGGIWFLLTRGLVDPMPLVVGYGALPIGIAASSLFTSLAPRPRRKK